MANESFISQFGLLAVSQTAINGLIEAGSGFIAGNGIAQLRENLNKYKPDANHEIQKAILESYLQATLQVCGDYGETLGVSAYQPFFKGLLPRFLAKAEILSHKLNHTEHLLPENAEELFRRGYYELPDKLRLKVEKGANRIYEKTFGEPLLKLGLNESPIEEKIDEKIWLQKVSEEYNEHLIQLAQNKLKFPEPYENLAINEVLSDKGLLMQAKNAQERQDIVKELLLQQVEQEIVGKFGELPSIFRTIFLDKWFNYFCGCFHYLLSKSPELARKFQSKLLADIEANTNKILKTFEKFRSEFGERLKNIETNLSWLEDKQEKGLDEIKQILYSIMPLLPMAKESTIQQTIIIEIKAELEPIISVIERTAEQTQNVVRESKGEIIEEVRNQFKTQNEGLKTQNQQLKEDLQKSLISYAEENEIKLEEAVQRLNKFRRNILAERKLNILEKFLSNHSFGLFDRFFSNLTPQEEFFVSLKERYTERYFNKLDGRFEITLIASDDLESEIKREYTGVYEGRGQLNEAFEYMRNAFQDANRLLIIGEPGVGKTVLLLKFANHLSDETVEKLNSNPELRLDDIKEPIPVIINLASWSEDYPSFKDWLIAMLKTGEGLSEAFADELLSNKKIFLLLDGLDELAKNETPETAAAIRAKCFDSIVGFLKGGQKAVICCRKDKYWQIRKDIGQDDAEQRRKMPEVFVRNLDINQIKSALERASKTDVDRESALNILKLLEYEKSGVFLKVLSVPFYFTTALEVFDSSILKEKTISANEKELKDYLVGKLIAEKLEISPPTPKKFKYKSSFKWLKWLAKSLKKKGKVTFELADLQPKDLRWTWVFKFLYGFMTCLTACVSLLLLIAFIIAREPQKFINETPMPEDISPQYIIGLIISAIIFLLLINVLFFLPISLMFGLRTNVISTEDTSQFSLKPLLQKKTWKAILFPTFIYGLLPTIPVAIIAVLLVIGSKGEISFSRGLQVVTTIFFFIAIFTLLERISSFSRTIKNFATLRNDYERLKTGFTYNLIRLTIVNICFVVIVNLTITNSGLLNYRPIIINSFFILSIFLVNTAIFQHFILRFCLIVINAIPIRYGTFLNYVSETRILEKDGGFWRFRHQELQDYFAKLP